MTKSPTITVSKASVANLVRRLFQDGQERPLAQVRDEVGYGATASQVSRALTKLVRAGELYRPQRGVYAQVFSENSLPSQTSSKVIPDQRSETAAPQVVDRKPEPVPTRPPVTAPRRASLVAPTWGPGPGDPVTAAPEPVAVLVAEGVADGVIDVEPYEVPNWIRDGAFLAPLFWLVITGLALIVGGLLIGLAVGAGCLVAVIAFYVGTARHRAKARVSRASTSRSRYRSIREAA